jgi:hypothetical protein
MEGAELGYTYAGSPIVCSEAQPFHDSEFLRYLPSASPGSRFPHVWLSDGRPIQDLIGLGYTLLDLAGDTPTEALETAMRHLNAPLEVIRLRDPAVHAIAGRKLVMLRPDLHVAWRADETPVNSEAVAARITGHSAAQM